MTSNVGSALIAEAAARSGNDPDASLPEGVRRQLTDALRDHFKPEFLNRIDEIVFFHPLNRQHIRQIIDIQLTALMRRLAERKITLTLDDKARDLLIEAGYDPVYGARPLKRTLQRQVLDPLALAVLQGEFQEGDTVAVSAHDGRIQFRKR
jgi:ATP-dependent Clp protease ATP-binding subunit ClpB